jgi:hypothetical protein
MIKKEKKTKLKKYTNCTISFLKTRNYHFKEKTVPKENKNKVSKKKENQKKTKIY